MRPGCTGVLERGCFSLPEGCLAAVCAGERVAQVTALRHDREPPLHDHLAGHCRLGRESGAYLALVASAAAVGAAVIPALRRGRHAPGRTRSEPTSGGDGQSWFL